MTRLKECLVAGWLTGVCLVMLVSSRALAGDRVVVVMRSIDEVLRDRLMKELSVVGFEPVPYFGRVDMPLQEIAEQNRAAAVVRLELTEGTIDVWVVDRVTNKSVVRSLPVEESGESETVAVIAAMELLRASLMELHAVRKPKGEIVPAKKTEDFSKPVPETLTREPPPESRVRVSGAIGLEGAAFGVDTGLAMRLPLALTVYFLKTIYVALSGSVFLVTSEKRVTGGEIRFSPWFAGVDAGVVLLKMRPPIYPLLGIGFGNASIHVEGLAEEPYQAKERWFHIPVAYLKGGLRVPVGDRFLASAGFVIGMATISNRVAAVDKEVVRLTGPLLSVDVMIGVLL